MRLSHSLDSVQLMWGAKFLSLTLLIEIGVIDKKVGLFLIVDELMRK